MIITIRVEHEVNINAYAEAIGYKIIGDKLVGKKTYELAAFKEVVEDFISETLEIGGELDKIESVNLKDPEEVAVLRTMLEKYYAPLED